ncbi:replication fork protection component Swi3-domain-containing protein [Pyrenochaeta sp. MPI-SDFR-AT-0127]|nr:replication fork protection component Swi3-domain-containing protein [Pyrenochaeta sp. MPI-SDFR-AT-0127]
MAPTSPQTHDAPGDDELDDILNGIVEGRDIPKSDEFSSNRKSDTTGALGIDEEIVITKKRTPIPKLNDERLLSDPGIPRLRKISKERLRFKGKGHEYGDIARMLNMYQLWLDDLYPRAKFADALTIIEKVGHTKRMQIMRKDWIDEGKPRRTREQDDEEVDEIIPDMTVAQEDAEVMDGIEKDDASIAPGVERDGHEPLLQPRKDTEDTAGDNPDDDELDALLAESADSNAALPRPLPSRPAAVDDPFADEMEAMADMDDMW